MSEFLLNYFSVVSDLLTPIILMSAVAIAIGFSKRWEAQRLKIATVQILGEFAPKSYPFEAGKLTPDQILQASTGELPEIAEVAAALTAYLNAWEFISLLVLTKTIDEELSLKMHRSTLVNAFQSNLEIILKLRAHANNRRIYENLERLAHEWRERGRDF